MLSDEWVKDLATGYFADDWAVRKAIDIIRETEDEVRKQDTELIRQMRIALTDLVGLYNTDEGCRNLLAYKNAIKAITAARKRLENT